uniref:RNA-directed DNA polymerase, eukaryota, reverse transcriptase zinc-binding domain protein n=1 Tax=Tanacetum cinerariifolium TaxID=118510 RepID=A0A6L2KIX4_TANCI|nr:RNA-directed DNA polymerase, eukaryota, reverse transcriptase zinc-binding domain protein [Tanacetum cinerariifolium]
MSWKNKLFSIRGRSTLMKSVLGIGSIKAKNLALTGKWRWCFLVEHNALWRKVISEIHGSDGGFMESFGSLAKPAGHGGGNQRVDQRAISLNNVINGILLNTLHDDKWVWSMNDSDSFSVKSLCVAIQNKMFYNNIAAPKFTWNSWIPRKVNIYVRRLALDRLPARSNLVRRGIQLDSSPC